MSANDQTEPKGAVSDTSSSFVKSANDECRLCFCPTKSDFLNLFQSWAEPWEDMAATIADDLYRLANIHVTEWDIHSKVICSKCYIKLREACQFVSYIQKNNSMLKHKFVKNEIKLSNIKSDTWPKPIEVSKGVNGIICNNLEIQIKQEMLSEEEQSFNNGYPETEIKIEPEEIQEQDANWGHEDDNSAFLDTEFLDDTLKEEPYLAEEELAKFHNVTENPTDNNLLEKLQATEQECMLCSKSFRSISGLKAHVVSQHSYKSVKRKTNDLPTPERQKRTHICAICRRSFFTSTDLMVHETCHNKYVCYSCKKKFDSFEELSKHRRRCKGNSDSNKFISLTDALSRAAAVFCGQHQIQKQLVNETSTMFKIKPLDEH